LADNIQGRTICALGDAAAMPVRAFVKQFRAEFEHHIEHKRCLVGPGGYCTDRLGTGSPTMGSGYPSAETGKGPAVAAIANE